ncbi:Pc16g06480 [Penicillium rubens Wisconsin 54-1255]|uniref:Pc16g06480 protein n=2 Tax=Penicillium chrysogenum species complex TaxID=254878 RepID=B6H9D3_PENRW|nr:Pc16g06480 [Penicillium rubens Wisconsin 54-1255]
MVNTLEHSLEGVIDDHDQRSDLIKNPRGPGWKDPTFQSRLRQKLDRDYAPFTGTVRALCRLLEDLSHKLGLETGDYFSAVSINPLNALKFRKIFNTAIYEDLLDKIDKTNQILKTISEQSQHREQSLTKPARRRRNLKRYREKRAHAKALYGIIGKGQKCRQCSCQDAHFVALQLNTNYMDSTDDTHLAPQTTSFYMIASPPENCSSTKDRRRWHEIKVQTDQSAQLPCTSRDSDPGVQPLARESKVRFELPKTKCLERIQPIPTTLRAPSAGLCSAFDQVNVTPPNSSPESIDYIFGNKATEAGYYMSLVRTFQGEMHLHSLQETLIGSPSTPDSPIQSPGELSRRDRLYLATQLACSLLELHGTWLQQHWRTKDIFFLRGKGSQQSQYKRPYLLRAGLHVPETDANGLSYRVHDGQDSSRHSNGTLFPLALALIELSLGKAISALRRPEDGEASDDMSTLNTVTRLLRTVYWESGSNYGDVVKECLYWPRSKGDGFEDPYFDESVFDTIVAPLLKDYGYFEGLSIRI